MRVHAHTRTYTTHTRARAHIKAYMEALRPLAFSISIPVSLSGPHVPPTDCVGGGREACKL